jgi:hypothetical protein
MFTAKLLGRIEFSSFTEMPETPTTPERSILEFIVHAKSQSRAIPQDSWVTCRMEGAHTINLLDQLYMGIDVFVEGSLEVVPFIETQTGTARAHTILHVQRVGISKAQICGENN